MAHEARNPGVYLGWNKIAAAAGALLLFGMGLAANQIRMESRLAAVEREQSVIAAEMIGQRRFDEFVAGNKREHDLLMQQLENLERKMDQHLAEAHRQ